MKTKKDLLKYKRCDNCACYSKKEGYSSEDKCFKVLYYYCDQFNLVFDERFHDTSKTVCDYWRKNESERKKLCREINFRYID